jgi:hypothetical protein
LREPVDDQILTTRVGLRIPDGLAFDAWQAAGAQIARVVNSSTWCLGDWLVYGEQRFSDRYRDAIAAVGLDYQTLRNYAWVTRRFELSRRRQCLTFQHHAEVASLPPQHQDEWLDLAERLGWSRNELRKAVRDARQGALAVPAVESALLPRIRVDSDRISRWREAAQRAEHDFEAWLVVILDDAAARELDVDDVVGEPAA